MAGFRRYRPLEGTADGIPAPTIDDDLASGMLPPSFDGNTYAQGLSGDPLSDTSGPVRPLDFAYGDGSNGPAAQLNGMPPVQPSMNKDSMEPAGKLKPIGVPPPVPPPDLAGAPQPPKTAAEQMADQYGALQRPDPKAYRGGMGRQIIGGVLGGLEGFASGFGGNANAGANGKALRMAVQNPGLAQAQQQFDTKRADLAENIKQADAAEDIASKASNRQQTAADRESKIVDGVVQHGGEFVPADAPLRPGMIEMPNPLAGDPRYKNFRLVRDQNFGKFQVTPGQADLSNGAVKAGDWLPLSEMAGFIKGGIDQGKPAKGDTVNVLPATAKALGVQSAPNEDGTVSVPTSLLAKKLEIDNKAPKEVPAPIQIGLRRLGLPSDTDLNTLTQDQATKLAQFTKADANQFHIDTGAAANAQTAALDRESARFAKGWEKAAADASSQIDKITDARNMINGTAEAQALGVPKVLTALVSGAGSGVRITQPELNAIAHARGIGGDIEGTFRSWMGQGKLTPTQQRQITGMLDDVHKRILQKQQIANEALDQINNGPDRPSIIGADQSARKRIADLERGGQLPQGGNNQPQMETQQHGADTYQRRAGSNDPWVKVVK